MSEDTLAGSGRVLLTGATGYIGGRLLRLLEDRTGSTAASPRSAPVPLTALVGALSAAVALIAIALLVAGYAT